MGGRFQSLREPVFRQWFLSSVLSASGTMTQGVAVSVLVYRLTGSGIAVGWMTTCTFLPLFLFGPYAGALVDRIGPRRVLLVTQTLLATLSGLLAVLTAAGAEQMWMLYAIAAMSGTVSAADASARQVYVIDLVGADRVSNAVALNEIVVNGSRILGPAIGGAALGLWGVWACCALNAASFLPPLIVVLRHKTRTVTHPQTEKIGGIRYVWRNPTIRACVLLAAASGMLFSLNVPLTPFTTAVFHLDGTGFGLMMATFGIGSLPGVVLAAAGPSRPSGLRVAVLAVATGVAILATAYAPTVTLAFVGIAVTGCVSIWFISLANTLVQLESDPGMRGRVMAVWGMALPGFSVATGPFIGWVGGVTDARLGFGVAGIAMILAAATGWRGLTRPSTITRTPVTSDASHA